jgi:hypothetical protein
MKNLIDYKKDGTVYFMRKEHGCSDNLVLGKTLIEEIAGFDFSHLQFITSKDYKTKKRIDTGVKLIKVAEFEDKDWGEVVVLDNEQVETLWNEYWSCMSRKIVGNLKKDSDMAAEIKKLGIKHGWVENKLSKKLIPS